MLATTLIFLAGLALLILAGIAVSALLDPQGRWLTPAAPAVGAASIVALAFPLGFLLTGRVVALLLCAVLVGLFAIGLWRRLRPRDSGPLGRELRAALSASPGEWLALVLGAAVGLLMLTPVFAIGFPTTIAVGIADGWARSVLAEWLLDHPLIDSAQHAAIERPIGTYSALPHELGAGFEYLVATVSTLVGRHTYETALPVAALAAPVALGGWAALHAAITERRLAAWQAAVLAIATVSPLFVLPLTENYLTQLFSLALWPFAMTSTYRFLQRPAVGRAVLAAASLGAVAGVYPQLAPWLGPPAVLLVVLAARDVPSRLAHRTPPRLRRPAAALAALALLGLAVVVVTPIELVRAYEGVVLFSGRLSSNASFPLFQAEQDLAIVIGGATQFSLPPFGGTSTWQLAPGVALLLGAAAVGVASLATMRPHERRPLLILAAGAGGMTVLTYAKYKFGDDYGYGAYKALISGGTLLTGLLIVALASSTARLRGGRLVAAGICLAVWVPVSAVALQRQRDGAQGFREADRGLIDALQRLPAKDVVLVEGLAEDDFSFRLRLTTGYAAVALDRPFDGLGSTFSYFTGGGAQPWRPSRPWRYVVVSDAASAFPAHRATIWHEAPFRIQTAPAVDVTPYALAPSPSIGTGPQGGRFWVRSPPGETPAADHIAGRVELIVSNRNPGTARARLRLDLLAQGRARPVTIAAEGGPAKRVELSRKRPRRVTYDVIVQGRSVRRVTLDPGAPVVGADGSLTPLIALTRIDVR
ncbi:MAG: hypothetical protein QOC68_555 [Solirubrobacteraceae bacterium]|jgi:hypothetical protein|nr:hypothetical protein [Solirubrobacteraceae bacterium]